MASTLPSADNDRPDLGIELVSDPIADLRSPGGSLISLYVDRPSPGGFAALLSDLTKPLREQSESMGKRVRKSVRADARRIHDVAPRLEVDPAPAFALFASDADDIFVLESLAHPAGNVSTLGPRPYLRPLRAAPRGLRSGIIVADRTVAHTFVGFEGLIEEFAEPVDAEIRKSNYGGFAGYEEQSVRAHAERTTAGLWKEAGLRLLEEHGIRPFDYLAIGGHAETIDEISRSLHPFLARLPRATFLTNPQSINLTILRSEILAQDRRIRRQRQESLAGRVCDTAWSGGSAVLGLGAVIEAANAQAIDTLVVAGPFTRNGTICNQCGHLARNGDECALCGSVLFEVPDIVAAVMDSTVAAGGKVHQVVVASALDVEGIGALTRFPVTV